MRIKLVSLSGIDGDLNTGFLNHPPLVPAIFKTLLKAHTVELDDVGIRLIHDQELLRELFSLRFHEDPGIADAYLAGRREDPAIDAVFEKILRLVDYGNFRVVGLSVPHSRCLPAALVLAKKIKEETGTMIVLGGFTFLKGIEKKFFQKYPFVDYVSVFNSYRPFLELVGALAGGKEAPEIGGMASRSFSVAPQVVSDHADSLPTPDFDTLPLEAYRNVPGAAKRFFRFNAGRQLTLPYFFIGGCLYNCSFCLRHIKDRKVVFTPVEKIADDLALMSEKYRTDCFAFYNYTANMNDAFLNDFCDILIKRKINILWSDSAKPRIDKRLLLKMRKAGCVCLTWGVESGSEAILKSMNKHHTAKDAAKALRDSHEAGIWNRANLIVGYPGETESQFRETLRFIGENSEFIDTLEVHKFFLSTSAILSDPGKFGIKTRNGQRTMEGQDFSNYEFDEINGVKWEEKLPQLDRRYQEAFSFYQALKKNTVLLDNRDLVYNIYSLYKKFNTKKAIIKHLEK